MFIPRMWSNEVERIGKKRCTPLGYALQGIGDLIGFLGLLILAGMLIYLVYRGVVGAFTWSLIWLLAVPFVIGIAGRVMVEFSWWMAVCKKFHYDCERGESRWIEAGEQRSYTIRDWEAVEGRRVR